ncbi:CD63 antigen-like isoform X2 [Magallana gigas]|uniref:CD63 antigen-like isoform X2 n=1 Tax=Magallana gigas TaxID=29159 RepID=UPI003341B708
MARGFCGKVGTVFLVIINIIFFLMGLGLVIAGALALTDVSNINTDHIKPLLDSIPVGSFEAGNLVKNLTTLIIVIGAFILLIAGLGLFGACCQNKFMLVTYAVLVLILLVMKIAVIILWFTMKNTVENEVKDKLFVSLKDNYKEDTLTNSNSISNAWNYMFMTLDCCGVNPVVSTKNDFDSTYWCNDDGSCLAAVSNIPKTCCLNVDENTYTTAPIACHSNVDTGTYNTKGCYDALKEKLLSQSPSIIGVMVTVIVIEVLAVIFAFWVCCQVGDKSANISDVAKT